MMVTSAAGAVASPVWVTALTERGLAATLTAGQAGSEWRPQFLSAHQNDTVVTVTELIIPETDTPGAKAVNVNRFIDTVLADAPTAEQDNFVAGLEWLDARSLELFGSAFVEATDAEQAAILTIIASPNNETSGDRSGVEFFDAVKRLTITGYYTSEVGMREELGDDGTLRFDKKLGVPIPSIAPRPGAVMQRETHDVVIVGSGATGGWAAKELTEAGLSVAVLEAGRRLDPSKDYSEHKRPYDMPFRGRRYSSQEHQAHQPILKQCYQCDEYTDHLFVDDTEHPYTMPSDRPFAWIRGRHVGGKSIMWARQSYRLSDYDFKATSRDGFGDDWPIDYAEIAPYYDRVEQFIGISGQAEGLAQLPDGKFLPPMALTCGEEILKKAIRDRFDRTMTIGRAAALTRAYMVDRRVTIAGRALAAASPAPITAARTARSRRQRPPAASRWCPTPWSVIWSSATTTGARGSTTSTG